MSGPLDVLSATTIANYALGALDGVTLHNPMLKALREKGDWEYDVGGTTMAGPVEVGYDKPIISAPGMDLTPNLKATNRYVQWSQVWAEIAGVKTVDNGMLRRNSGKQALVKLRDKEVPAMLRGMLDKVDGLLHQFLNQNIASPTQSSGTVTGLPLAGLPSFLLAPGSASLNGSVLGEILTGSAVAATDREAVCTTQTYGGLSLAPSGLSGIDNLVADAWRPCLVNSTSTAWNGSASVATNILAILQWAANRSKRFSASDPNLRPDAEFGAWLSYDYFQLLGNAIAAKQTIYLSGGKSGAGVSSVPLGTDSDMLPHAGYAWRWDERMPAACGYLITWPQVMAKVQPLFAGIEGNGNPLGKSGEDAGLIETAITYDPVRRQWIVTGTAPMQIQCQPRYFTRIGAYA
jgi:hypothetical protein